MYTEGQERVLATLLEAWTQATGPGCSIACQPPCCPKGLFSRQAEWLPITPASLHEVHHSTFVKALFDTWALSLRDCGMGLPWFRRGGVRAAQEQDHQITIKTNMTNTKPNKIYQSV